MATRKVYEVRAVNPYTDQRVFQLISAVSIAQAEYFFKKEHGASTMWGSIPANPAE